MEVQTQMDDLRHFLPELTPDIFDDAAKGTLAQVETLIINVVMGLLRTEIRFETTLEYTTFRNPVVLFFILQSIHRSDGSFKSEPVISKLASKIIYGLRLFLLGSI